MQLTMREKLLRARIACESLLYSRGGGLFLRPVSVLEGYHESIQRAIKHAGLLLGIWTQRLISIQRKLSLKQCQPSGVPAFNLTDVSPVYRAGML